MGKCLQQCRRFPNTAGRRNHELNCLMESHREVDKGISRAGFVAGGQLRKPRAGVMALDAESVAATGVSKPGGPKVGRN